MKLHPMFYWLAGAVLSCGQMIRGQSSMLDTTFDPGTGAGGGIVESVLLQPDGRVLVSGDFTSFNGVPQGYIARLNSDGSVDTSFKAQPGYWVRHMALQTDGKIIIGGFFTNVEGVPRNRIARLNSDGTLDRTFDPGLGADKKIVEGDDKDPFVFAVAVQPNGQILAGGNFALYNGKPSSGLVRLNADGSADPTFNVGAGANSWVRSLLLLPNGQLMVSGWFTSFNNQTFNRMVRLNTDGTPDSSFYADFGDATAVYTMALQPNGNLVVGGHFYRVNSIPRTSVAAVTPSGSADASFDPGSGADGFVECARMQPDGRIVVGGYFSNIGGTVRHRVARLNPDGSVDGSLSADVDNFIWTVALQPDGKILVCGGFTSVDGVSRSGVARLLSGGQGTPIVTAVRIRYPSWDHGQFSVTVPTVTGNKYELEYRPISSGPWTSLPSVPGDGTMQQLIDPAAAGGAGRLYRVRVN